MSIAIEGRIPNAARVVTWLETHVRSHLKPDVSNYAKGRLRVWLRHEPTLTNPTRILPALPTSDGVWNRLQELLAWPFDFALVTYSGDGDTGIGISAHRDASYADYEAYALHLSGECRFDYWEGRPSFGRFPETRAYTAKDAPTHSYLLTPGEIVHFNCKNLHAASPGSRRWNINFWRRKEGLVLSA